MANLLVSVAGSDVTVNIGVELPETTVNNYFKHQQKVYIHNSTMIPASIVIEPSLQLSNERHMFLFKRQSLVVV